MKISNDEIQRIRDVSIYDILGLGHRDRRLSMCCPLPNHRDKTPSFTIYPDNSFHCFGCEANGKGAIDFCVALGYTFVEACEELRKYI